MTTKYRTPQKGVILTGPRVSQLDSARQALTELGVEVVSDQRVLSAALDVFLRECDARRVEIPDSVDLRFSPHYPPTSSQANKERPCWSLSG